MTGFIVHTNPRTTRAVVHREIVMGLMELDLLEIMGIRTVQNVLSNKLKQALMSEYDFSDLQMAQIQAAAVASN